MSKKSLKKINVENALVIDARTLVNPHSAYPDINGLHPHVQLFICRQQGFVKYISDLIHKVHTAPETNIVLICDAGMHRSVFLVDVLARVFVKSHATHVSLRPSKHEVSIRMKDLIDWRWYHEESHLDQEWSTVRVMNWNCRGFDTNKEVFEQLVQKYNVNTCILQETYKTFDHDVFN